MMAKEYQLPFKVSDRNIFAIYCMLISLSWMTPVSSILIPLSTMNGLLLAMEVDLKLSVSDAISII